MALSSHYRTHKYLSTFQQTQFNSRSTFLYRICHPSAMFVVAFVQNKNKPPERVHEQSHCPFPCITIIIFIYIYTYTQEYKNSETLMLICSWICGSIDNPRQNLTVKMTFERYPNVRCTLYSTYIFVYTDFVKYQCRRQGEWPPLNFFSSI